MTRMSLSLQQYTSSPARLTNTEATFRGIITLMWTAADPSSHSCYTATWQVADTHIKTHTRQHAWRTISSSLSLSSCLILHLSVLHTYNIQIQKRVKIKNTYFPLFFFHCTRGQHMDGDPPQQHRPNESPAITRSEYIWSSFWICIWWGATSSNHKPIGALRTGNCLSLQEVTPTHLTR